ncbi:MAG: hypothetical protein BMS9Abin37_1625 [Acidobacteriota bacterium]|nr:MAG: hypothetical protein BMS9Abin37_1625 [Acidobacteriota bacterium]
MATTTIPLQVDIDSVDVRPPLLGEKLGLSEITDRVVRPLETAPTRGWYVVFALGLGLLGVFGLSAAWLVWEGVGIWGNNVPVGWGWPIVNFVFWVGIGHAGTLISAVLFLFRQRWRTSINRAAEAMTLFAVICALMFPLLHTGRPWLAYWMLPIPNQMGLWPQFRSPLMWDVFAVNVYFAVSLMFWYVGLIPDLATMRDRSSSKLKQIIFGLFALGWRSSVRHWRHYEKAYLLLAGLATPLVLSVHSVVSFDFAVSQLPGWHSTIFPPYFVAGAIFSGLAMVITLMVICRRAFGLETIITPLHFDRMTKLILAMSWIVGYAYAVEFFISWYSDNPYESFAFANRAGGPFAWAFWIMVTCNVVVPQIFWFRRARTHMAILFIASILINVGMWFERFVIVVTSLHRDFLPSSWGGFTPSLWDITTLLGSFGLFLTLFCLFVRFLPMVAMAEVKGATAEPSSHEAEPEAPLPAVAGAEADTDTDTDTDIDIDIDIDIDNDNDDGLDGVIAELDSAEELLLAANRLRVVGYQHWDAHSPYPVHGLDEAMGLPRSRVPLYVLALGLMGAVAGFALQWWTSASAYPLIVSGKPLFSWPAFIPIAFECGMLGGALGAVIGFLRESRLPRHHHPLFAVERFERASNDKFYISVSARDPRFGDATKTLLAELGARVEVVHA